jgi:hypothetical protein
MDWTSCADNQSLSIHDGIGSGFLALCEMTGEDAYDFEGLIGRRRTAHCVQVHDYVQRWCDDHHR